MSELAPHLPCRFSHALRALPPARSVLSPNPFPPCRTLPPLPRSSRLSSVLEAGDGGPVTLAVLYMELSARLGLPLRPVLLDGGRCVCCVCVSGGGGAARWGRRGVGERLGPGRRCDAKPSVCVLVRRSPVLQRRQPLPRPSRTCRYLVLAPEDTAGVGLCAAGERFVVDAYSGGLLLSVAEVRGCGQAGRAPVGGGWACAHVWSCVFGSWFKSTLPALLLLPLLHVTPGTCGAGAGAV